MSWCTWVVISPRQPSRRRSWSQARQPNSQRAVLAAESQAVATRDAVRVALLGVLVTALAWVAPTRAESPPTTVVVVQAPTLDPAPRIAAEARKAAVATQVLANALRAIGQ